ncbi:DUF3084 domain-containing protein [Veillonella sp. R32]|uniref:DUF3084 domain-containing protein n=1 Tax=Veillonella sp. R32 TaxID=2021312 RepID=UPI00138A020B|nr:DUF3084 domain-containing protein [Veillonella sp. R32]KAF1683951.1 hyaluronidase (HylP) [Veillonella sp. R32]
MLVGLNIILIIAIMGGAIAFIGDKLGSRIGKKRMSIFGLRPKHTSIIMTIITGIFISASTLGILAFASENVRIALFGMEQLQAEMDQLNSDVAAKNKELEAGKKELSEKTVALNTMRKDVQATQEELEEARAARNSMSEELISVQEAYRQADARLAQSTNDVKALESTKQELEAHIEDLKVTTKRLEEGITHVREGTVLFRVGEVLSGALIRPGLNEEESAKAITNVLNDTNGLILRRLGIDENKAVIYVSRSNLEDVAKQVANASEPMTIRITAAANIIYGEAALAEIHAYPYRKVYDKGDVIWTTTVQGGGDAQFTVLSFLKDVNGQAKTQGILPDPLSGDVGSMPGDELFDTIRELSRMSGSVRLEAVVREDTYTTGPVQIELRLSPE